VKKCTKCNKLDKDCKCSGKLSSMAKKSGPPKC